MASVDHEYCLQLKGFCMAEPIMMITQFMPFGSVVTFFEKHMEKVNERMLLTWGHQIAEGMHYLESRAIVHRDLAARNILIKKPDHIKISDFGLSRIIQSNEDCFYAKTNSLVPVKWLAIESICERKFTHKSDVWSYGVCLWEIFTFCAKPYNEIEAIDLVKSLLKGVRLTKPNMVGLEIYTIMLRCWLEEPLARPSFKELGHEFSILCDFPKKFVNITLAEKRKEFKTTSDKARIDDYVRNSCVFNDDEYKDEECINRNGLKPRDKSKINSYLLADEGIDLNCAERSTSTDYERSNIHSSINEYSDELESEHVKIFRRVNKPLAPRVEAENFNELDDFISNETTTETNTFDANTLTIVTPQRTNSNLFNRNFNNIKNLIFKRLPAKSRLESQISSTTTSSYLSSSTYTPQTPTDSLTKQNSNYEEQQSLLPSTSYSESSSIPTRSHSSSSYNSTFNNSFESNSKDQTNKVQKRESKANSGN
jgi:serine/threonine protein kinase